MNDDVDTGGPLDVATLELLAGRATSHPLVESWAFRPDTLSPRYLELHLDEHQYPASVDTVRLDVRWFEGGDYSFHYLEFHGADEWQCRWDRHTKPEAPRSHFHPPPDASAAVEESGLQDTHPFDVLFDVLDWCEERVETLHEE